MGIATTMEQCYYDARITRLFCRWPLYFSGLSDDEIDDAELYGYAGIKIAQAK
jgi:hypothetical protein